MVERDSAIQKCSLGPQDAQPIDENHSDMVKFAVADLHYTSALHCFRRLLGKSFSRETPEWNPTAPASDMGDADTGDYPNEASPVDERAEYASNISSQPCNKGKIICLRLCSPPNALYRDIGVTLAGCH